MTRAVFYDDSHRRIAEGGIEGIAAVLRGDDEVERASLLLCPGFTLIPITAARWRMRAKFLPFLQELLLSERSQAIRDDILQLLGDYCGDFSVLRSKICEASGELLQGIKRLIER